MAGAVVQYDIVLCAPRAVIAFDHVHDASHAEKTGAEGFVLAYETDAQEAVPLGETDGWTGRFGHETNDGAFDLGWGAEVVAPDFEDVVDFGPHLGVDALVGVRWVVRKGNGGRTRRE